MRVQAQEVCEGGSVQGLIQKAAGTGLGKRLYSYMDAHRWVMQVAKALQYLHESHPQLLHRDLKVSSMLLIVLASSTASQPARRQAAYLCAGEARLSHVWRLHHMHLIFI